MCAQRHRRGLGPTETCYSGPNVALLHAQTTEKGWDTQTQVILVLITLYCMPKTTGEVWDPSRLVILLQKSLFCVQKPQMRAGTHRD